MDAFRLCLAMGPMAIYLLLIGAINLSRRPFLIWGARDTAVLGLAIGGLILAGPMELFLPVTATLRFGPYVWIFLVILYAMGLVLWVLTARPRLVIYNVSVSELRPVLADVVAQLDSEARWAGDSLLMPGLGVQLHMESFARLRNVALVSIGGGQMETGWRQLEQRLRQALAGCEVPRNLRALDLISAGSVILLFLAAVIYADPRAVARAMIDMVRL